MRTVAFWRPAFASASTAWKSLAAFDSPRQLPHAKFDSLRHVSAAPSLMGVTPTGGFAAACSCAMEARRLESSSSRLRRRCNKVCTWPRTSSLDMFGGIPAPPLSLSSAPCVDGPGGCARGSPTWLPTASTSAQRVPRAWNSAADGGAEPVESWTSRLAGTSLPGPNATASKAASRSSTEGPMLGCGNVAAPAPRASSATTYLRAGLPQLGMGRRASGCGRPSGGLGHCEATAAGAGA
mmetsp:Transcript_99239/g.285091  ORF Transcript_99239/g.285091 Transcript_99239/m.285091 type:complete len:238 (-) Transcript_99239:491-1204(-)